jgi:hypothetical protein
MSDITKCRAEGCKKKRSCYRFLAPASEYQSYFMHPPVKEDGTCNQYWEVKAEQKRDEDKQKDRK